MKTLDTNEHIYLRAAMKSGPRGTAIAFDEVPIVVALSARGLISRMQAEVDRPYGSALITPAGISALASHDHTDHIETICARTVLDALMAEPDAFLERIPGGLRLQRKDRAPVVASSVRTMASALDFEASRSRG